MRQKPTDDELLRSYLLGELPEPEADRLEQRLLAEDDLFDLMEALEAELLAAGSRGELAPAERERVFRRLAFSPQGWERLALAQSLNRLADEHLAPVVPLYRPMASKPVFQWTALAAAALLATAGLFWIIYQEPQEQQGGHIADLVVHERSAPARPIPVPPAPVEPVKKKEPAPQASPDRLARKHEGAPARRSEPVKAMLVLALTTLRDAGEELDELHLPSNAEVAEIQIDLQGLEDAGPFHASVRAKGEEPVWDKKGLKPQKVDWGMALVLDVPARQLAPGLYEVAVTSSTEPEELTQEFRVVRESR